MGEVVVLPGLTKLPIPVERVLDGAKNLDEVLVLGYSKEGRLVVAASNPDKARVLLMAQQFVHKLIRGDYDDES